MIPPVAVVTMERQHGVYRFKVTSLCLLCILSGEIRLFMRDVVVIGGGLSGLAACYELEKRGAAYTVIEVKRRFGGGIRSSAEGGFIIDACAFAFGRSAAMVLPPEFALSQQILAISDDAGVFRQGTESLVSAYTDRLQGGRLMRMAVSSIGRLGDRFTICLENGIMLDAGALILAVPARYAARMLWNLAPEAAERLAAFRYDSIRRVSLGYRKRDLPAVFCSKRDTAIRFIITTDEPGRVPSRDHLLMQVGLRAAADATAAEAIEAVTQSFGWSAAPQVARVDYWQEADVLSEHDDTQVANLRSIHGLLPGGVSLIGSDYCSEAQSSKGVARLDARILSGKQAAQDALEFLKAAKE
jgi:protoporphyrinogen oxidase